MNLLTTPILYGLAIAALLLGLIAGVQTYRLSGERTAHAQTKAEHAAVLQNIANLTAKAVAEARAIEQDWAARYAEADKIHQWELSYAQDTADRTVADLAAGNLRLQKQWRGCQTAARVPGTAPRAGQPDGAADLRGEAAGRIVRVGAQCDATIKALQTIAKE